METKVIVKVEETKINFDVCEELYEMWTGRDLEDRIFAADFWQTQVSDMIEDVKDDKEFDSADKYCISLVTLLSEVNKLNGDVMIQF